MGLKKIVTSCIGGSKESQEEYPALDQKKDVEPNVYSGVYSGVGHKNLEREDYLKLVQKVNNEDKIFIAGIINNILQKEITLEDLNNLKELKKENKELFLEDLKLLVCDGALHKLNQKIMEHAKDLTASDDSVFLLRGSNNGIFRDLFYLEAKNNKWKVSIDDNQTLTFSLPKWLLELYQSLTINFYEKKFEEKELQKKLYQKLLPDCQIPFEKLIEEKELQKKLYQKLSPDCQIPFEKLNFFESFIECLKEFYIKNSLAQSIMYLFISNFFKQDVVKNADVNKLTVLGNLEKKLNDMESVYIKSLGDLDILSNLGYPTYNEIIPLESIEILGNSESPV
ncbi:MAG TPA: DUF5410 domain-containing protein [Rickettsia endosymbiont of Omalisus fontisbellaquei]|nr:DUF5410 domain-containing protein [Rickettsia endosymbiont of Omalisus fontisbellaquei]